MKKADVAIGAKVVDIIKKNDFCDEHEKIVRMSQLIDKIMNVASSKHPAISQKFVSII